MQSILNKRASKLLLGAALAGLFTGTAANAAFLIDVRATAVTGQGSSLGDGKTNVQVVEGGTVTFTTFVHEVPNGGLFSYDASIRTRNEAANGTPISPPTATDTVLSPVSGSEQYLTYNNANKLVPSYIDLPNGPSNTIDANDTDIDMRAIHGEDTTQTTGLGTSSTDLPLFSVTYSAMDLDDSARPFNRTVSVNTFGTGTTTTNGNAVIRAYNTLGNASAGNAAVSLAASNIGSDVSVSVTPAPEPATMGLLGLVGILGVSRRSRKA